MRPPLTNAARASGADRIVAVLDPMDGDPDIEDRADDEPSLAALENATELQVVYMRGNDQDRETEVSEIVLPEVATEPQPVADILLWRGRGNFIAAVGSLIVDLLERA